MWRLVYSKYKLTPNERQTVQQALDDYTCGAQLADLLLTGRIDAENVCVRSICCFEPLEKMYYSVGLYDPIIIFCCSDRDLVTKEGCYLSALIVLTKSP